MKKFIKYFALFSMAAFGVAACSTDKTENIAPSNTRYVTFVAEEVNSRTTFGDKTGETYPTLWTNTDKIHVSKNGTEYPIESIVEPSADGRTAQFGAEISLPFSGSVRYFAISPSSCYSYFYSSYYEYYFRIPTNQISSVNSCDPSAQILLARSEEVTVDSDYVPMHFEHITAYGKFSIKNLTPEAGAVKSVTLKATKPLTNYFELYWTESTPRIASSYNSANQVVVTTSSVDNIWFGCVPADLSGTSLDVTVVAENGDYTKKIDLAGKTLAFKAGEVSEFVVDMAGIEPPKTAGKFVVGGESVSCFSAVVGYELGSWSKNMTIYIGEVAGTTTREIESGKYLSLTIDLEKVSDFSNFSIADLSVYISASQSYSSSYCVGTASVVMSNGNLKLSISDAMIPEGWGTTPTIAFSAQYDGSYTEECTSYSTSNMTKDVDDSYKYYYGIDKLFVNQTESRSVVMFGCSSSVATVADIKNGECGAKVTIVAGEEGKLLDVATSQSKVEFYDYATGKTHVAKSGSLMYINLNGKVPYIYGYVYFDDQQESYLEFGLSCEATESDDVDLTPATK